MKVLRCHSSALSKMNIEWLGYCSSTSVREAEPASLLDRLSRCFLQFMAASDGDTNMW